MKQISERILAQGEWLRLKETRFEAADGSCFMWESVERRKSNLVAIVYARLVPSDRIVLIGQYRPLVQNRVIALPAGFIDTGDVASEALRELREETGYVGTIRSVSPLLVVNAALVNDRLHLVEVDVDETAPQNKRPQQELEPSEEIETFLVPRAEVKAFLVKKLEQGYEVGSGLWYMFCGLASVP